MTLDQLIAQAATKAAIAARNGDDDAWREWSDETTRLLDQRDRTERRHHCAPASFYATPANV